MTITTAHNSSIPETGLGFRRPITPQEREELYARARKAKQARIALARKDINVFARYVIKDEATHEPIIQAPVHERMHALADKHKRFAMITCPELGKTVQMGVVRILFELGHNPEKRFAIVSENVAQANKTIRVLKTYIAESDELHEVFPNLRPGSKWTESAITVRRTSNAKDASVTSYGPGKNITGSRIDGMVIDDLVSSKNTLTKHQRDLMFNYVMRTLTNRLTKDGWMIFLANAWHPDDALHRLARASAARAGSGTSGSELAWHVERIPVLNPDGSSVWPDRWPMDRIRAKKQEYIEAGAEREWVRQYLCIAREDTDARFTEAAINRGLDAGRGIELIYELDQLQLPPNLDPQLPNMPPRCAYDAKARIQYVQSVLAHHAATKTPPPFLVTVGVDLAVARHSKADLTALVALCVLPSGHRIVLDIKAGRFTWAQICGHIIDFNDRFSPQVILVENVAAQDYVLQHIRDISDARVIGYTTGRGKADPNLGLESIAGLLEGGWMVLPGSKTGIIEGLAEGSEMRALCDDMLFYSPASHVGDRLMALWFANTAVTMIRRRATQLSAYMIGGALTAAEKAKARALAHEAELAAEYARKMRARVGAGEPGAAPAPLPPAVRADKPGKTRTAIATPGLSKGTRRTSTTPAGLPAPKDTATGATSKPASKLPYWYPKDME